MSREHGVELRHELVQRHAIGVALEPGREGVRDWDVGTTLSQLGKDFLSLELIFLLADLVLGEEPGESLGQQRRAKCSTWPQPWQPFAAAELLHVAW